MYVCQKFENNSYLETILLLNNLTIPHGHDLNIDRVNQTDFTVKLFRFSFSGRILREYLSNLSPNFTILNTHSLDKEYIELL